MLPDIIYALAVQTDNSIAKVVSLLGAAGIEEFAKVKEEYPKWTTSEIVNYYATKYAIPKGFEFHPKRVPTIPVVLSELLNILKKRGYGEVDAYKIMSATKSVAKLEQGDQIYPQTFYESFKEELDDLV